MSQKKFEKALDFQKIFNKFSQEQITEKLKEYWKKYRFLDKIKTEIDFSNKYILDVGSGLKTSVMHLFPDSLCYLIDPLMDQLLSDYNNIPSNFLSVQQGTAENLPFIANSFDVVFCTNALDHFESPDKAFTELLRVLIPGGYLVITVDIFTRVYARDERHPHTFTDGLLMGLLHFYNSTQVKIIMNELSEVNACFHNYLIGKELTKPLHGLGERVLVLKIL